VKTSLQSWLRNRWLVQHKPTSQEISNLFAISDRDLHACNTKNLPADWRFAIAYNAALQAATAALAAAGYRASRESHHHRVIQSLEFTLDPERKMIDTFDTFRKKRNISSYDLAGSVSDKEAKEMHELAAALRARVERWIRKNHPMLLAHTTHP
jgi:predicted DNA-binding ribbon-helix-helix protein